MAYEFRRPVFNFAGVLSGAVSPTDTTISSTAFTSLPSDYTTAQYLPLVLADDATGKAEVVWVVGHTAGASSVTVVRAREGTTGQAFSAGNVVRGAATLWDLGPVAVGSRSGLPANPFYGMRATIIDEALAVEYAFGGWSAALARKHRWANTNASWPHDTPYAPIGLVAQSPVGNVATVDANNRLYLNKPGLWSLALDTLSDHNVSGWVLTWFSWPAGAMLELVQEQLHRAATGFGASGQVKTRITWVGYVDATQCTKPITPYIQQKNSASSVVTGTQTDLMAEYLGA